jgi:hypothetical protein
VEGIDVCDDESDIKEMEHFLEAVPSSTALTATASVGTPGKLWYDEVKAAFKGKKTE